MRIAPEQTPADRRVMAGALAVIGAIYALTLPRNFTEGEDAVYYAEHVAVGRPDWHPNHLLYEPVNHWIVHALGTDAVWTMQVVSLLATLLALALVWELARAAGAGTAAALAAMTTVAGCFAVWLYGLYPDTYALPLPVMLGALLALVHGRIGAAAVLAALACLLHQSHLFLWPASCLWLLMQSRNGMNVARYSIIFVGIVVLAYLAAGRFALDHASLGETLLWARGHASDGLWTPLSLLAPVKALIGLASAVFASFFLFADPALAARVEALFPGRLLVEEAYFAETGLLLGPRILMALTLLGALALAGLAARASVTGRRHPLIGLLALTGAVYAAVVMIWEPVNKEFWIAVLPLLSLAVFLRLDPLGRMAKAVAILAISMLWLANGAGAMVGFADRDTDYWYQANRAAIEDTAPGDVIVDHCGYICTGYLLLFSPAEILPADALDRAEATGPGRILITDRALSALHDTAALGHEALAPRILGAGDGLTELARRSSP